MIVFVDLLAVLCGPAPAPRPVRRRGCRRDWVKEIRRQTVTHKRFQRLVDQWIDLSIEHSRLTMKIAEPGATR